MNRELEQQLFEWPKPFIQDQDLAVLFRGDDRKRFDSVKYALKKGSLIHIRRGLYLVGPPFQKGTCDPFLLSQMVYGPSYISFESALSYHGWIPEAVYMVTSACARRSKDFHTPLGHFRYWHIPKKDFYLSVSRIEEKKSIFLMADPWKALADMLYVFKKKWMTLEDLELDLRVERETILESQISDLELLKKHYPVSWVRQRLKRFWEELDESTSD